MSADDLLDHLQDPEHLEKRYRADPKGFAKWLTGALAQHPDSETLRVWNARLNVTPPSSQKRRRQGLMGVVLLSLTAGLLVKLPAFAAIDPSWYYQRFAPLIVISALCIYFLSNTTSIHIKRLVTLAICLCILLLLLLPNQQGSASITMAVIYMPLVMAAILGLAFMGEEWHQTEARLLFIRYLGEISIHASIILLGGIVLTAITVGLFELIHVQMFDWYMQNVVVIGIIASPIVATYLYDRILDRDNRLATMISNLFSPLFLLTICVYLAILIYRGDTPFYNRDFLITFNGLLLIVWAMTVFSISGKSEPQRSRLMDAINIALILVTLAIDGFALAAILFRTLQYGITANRVAVTGANLLIFGHLLLITREYLRQIKIPDGTNRLDETIANYLPLYSTWSSFVVLILPLLFAFR
jgi:hypothetical protein